MSLEIFIWSWVHFHPVQSLRRYGKLLLFAAVILLPLFFMNVSLARQGFILSAPSLTLSGAQSYDSSASLDYELDE